MKQSLLLAAALTMAASSVAMAQPDGTTDVDATTTPTQQSPLAPEQAETAPPKPVSIEDLISGAAPYEPPPSPAAKAAPDAPPEPVVAVPVPPSAVAQPAPVLPAPAGPRLVVPTPSPAAPRPGLVTGLGARFEPPPTATDAAYENRVLGVFHTAQGKQGPLDGRWLIQTGGVGLYTLQFSDPGAGESRVEGAWRNLRNAGANSSGFIEEVARHGNQIVVRFTDTGLRRTEVWLTPDLRGGWSGEAVWPEGRQSVVMARDQSVEVRAFAVPAYTPPPPPPPPKAKPVAKKRKAAPAKKRRPAAAPSRARAKRR